VFQIRHVEPRDIFSVIKIAHESLPERYNPAIFTHFLEIFPEGFLVAESLHKIVGFIIGIKTGNRTARILMLSVIESLRRKGIGSALITKFMQEMLSRNINQIELEVRTSNTPAINFYKKHGFNIVETFRKFYQNQEDAYRMKRVLSF
jgi:ribosomal-protein-alanine acetyltransferase